MHLGEEQTWIQYMPNSMDSQVLNEYHALCHTLFLFTFNKFSPEAKKI